MRRASRRLAWHGALVVSALGYAATRGLAQGGVPPRVPGAQVIATPVARVVPRTLRVVTWNVGANSVAPPARAPFDIERESRPAAFGRVMRAIDPDVACLQEFTAGPSRAAALFDAIRPLPHGRRWQAYSALGNTIVSRFPLHDASARVFRFGVSRRAHAIARIDVPDSIAPVDPLLVCTHLQAKGGQGNAAFRLRHANAIVADLRERAARTSRTPGLVRPILVLGDFNAVDRPAPYLMLLERADGGPGFPLTEAQPLHNGVGPDRWTWRSDRQPFAPGVLDYVFYSADAFVARNAFVLNTVTLDGAALLAVGLRRHDVVLDFAGGVYDHLPVAVDLEAVPPPSMPPR